MPDVVPLVRFLFADKLEVEPQAVEKVLAQPVAAPILAAVSEALASVGPWGAGAVEDALRTIPEKLETKPKVVFQTVRVAVTGSLVSLPLFESIALLGRGRTLARLETARVAIRH
jgi:glutamyl-tRNA synthetase